MNRIARNWRGCLLFLGLTGLVMLVPFQTIRWDGSFANAEYRLTFLDGASRPVPGVTLRVLTRAGGECYLYPINEFLPGQTPTSDADGRMVFHHVSHGVEFGGRESNNLLGMLFEQTAAPQYVCVFSVAGREVHRVRYDDLRRQGERERLPSVTRPWQESDWPLRESVARHEDRSARRLRLYDVNGDGQLDREERVAAGYFDRLSEQPEFDRRKRDIEFIVVERTITISWP